MRRPIWVWMGRRRVKMMTAMMTPCLRRVASAPCSLIGRNGRNVRQGSLMIVRPLRGGQESWLGVGAIQLSCCWDVAQQQKFQLLKISESTKTTYYYTTLSVILINLNVRTVAYTAIQYEKHKKFHKRQESTFDGDWPHFGPTHTHMYFSAFSARKSS